MLLLDEEEEAVALRSESPSTASHLFADLLSEEEVLQLVSYYSSIDLSPDQCDRIADKWIDAADDEKDMIAHIYCKLFSDVTFAQRLDAKVQFRSGSSIVGRRGDEEGEEARRGRQRSGRRSEKKPPSSRREEGERKATTSTHHEFQLRQAAAEILPRLVGDGPFTLAFGLVESPEDRKSVLELYRSQFTHPDAATMAKMVTLPRSQSTRTRKNIKGSYTWYIRCLTTDEIVCCVTAVVHRGHTSYVEVPLFATRGGYKKNGFARLLNAALLQFCIDHVEGCPLLVVSADKKAVPFWAHLGYEEISKQNFSSIEFMYEHNFFKFTEALTMTVSVAAMKQLRAARMLQLQREPVSIDETGPSEGDGARRALAGAHCALEQLLVLDVLEAMPRFLLSGEPCLHAGA